MPHRDRVVVLAFVVALTVLAAGILLPVASPGLVVTGPSPSAPPSPSANVAAAFRDGVVGRPSSITPLTARTRADHDLVALVFRGLVGLGPGQTLVPDLAESWTIADKGRAYTFRIRPDAVWEDGAPVTAQDVVFTVGLLKDENFTGATGASWTDVTAKAIDAKTVKFTLGKPIGGFLEAARQPLLPEHLLTGTSVTDLADSAYAKAPVGNGPYRIVSLDADHAILEPSDGYAGPADPGAEVSPSPGASPAVSPPGTAAVSPASSPASSPAASAEPTVGSSAEASPSGGGDVPVDLTASGLARIDLRFFDDETRLAAAFRAGELDAASGLDPQAAATLSRISGTRLLRYPSAIFSSVTFNLRPDHPRFADMHFRRAITMAIDRARIIAGVYGGNGALAETPIPPSSWAFSPAASRALPFDRSRAATELKKSGWKKTAKGWVAPKSTKPFTLKLLALDKASNPVAFDVATRIATDLTSFGIKTTVDAVKPATLVQRIRSAAFDAVVLDVNIGLDPDLYPLLASTQAGADGSNISGIQSAELDVLLEAARLPGTTVARKKRYAALQDYLSTEQVMPPLLFRDYLVAYRADVQGPQPRELGDLSDRFWDVLTWRLAAGG